MSEAYERERQNNARLDELHNKVSALRGVTVDIYDSASRQTVIDETVRYLSPRPPAHNLAVDRAGGSISSRALFQYPAVMQSPFMLMPFPERDLLLHDDPDEGLCRPSDPYGCLGQQDRYSKTLRHHHWHLPSALLRN
jgi:hypothetical protein